MIDRNSLDYHSVARSFILFHAMFDWAIFCFWRWVGPCFELLTADQQTLSGPSRSVSVHAPKQEDCLLRSNDHKFLLHLFRSITYKYSSLFFYVAQPPPTPPSSRWVRTSSLYRSHSDIYTQYESPRRLISSSQRPLARQHTANTRDEYACTSAGFEPAISASERAQSYDLTARPMGSAPIYV